MVLALGADVQVGLQVGLEDGLAAARTLDPETLGADPLLGRVPIAIGRGRIRNRRSLV